MYIKLVNRDERINFKEQSMITYEEFSDIDMKVFAKKAAKAFKEDKDMVSYTYGEIEGGDFFALRFGLGGNRVVVFKIDDCEPVINYPLTIGDTNE